MPFDSRAAWEEEKHNFYSAWKISLLIDSTHECTKRQNTISWQPASNLRQCITCTWRLQRLSLDKFCVWSAPGWSRKTGFPNVSTANLTSVPNGHPSSDKVDKVPSMQTSITVLAASAGVGLRSFTALASAIMGFQTCHCNSPCCFPWMLQPIDTFGWRPLEFFCSGRKEEGSWFPERDKRSRCSWGWWQARSWGEGSLSCLGASDGSCIQPRIGKDLHSYKMSQNQFELSLTLCKSSPSSHYIHSIDFCGR